MKKVRIMLMSLMVVAIVGVALAFNVKSIGLFCSTTSTRGGCTINEPTIVTFATVGDTQLQNKYCTTQKGTNVPCLTVTNE